MNKMISIQVKRTKNDLKINKMTTWLMSYLGLWWIGYGGIRVKVMIWVIFLNLCFKNFVQKKGIIYVNLNFCNILK